MHIFSNRRKQNHREEQRFALGERSLRAYLAGGNAQFLKDAEDNLSFVGFQNERYLYARFYLAITKAQLRKADESIAILKELQQRVSSEPAKVSDLELARKIPLQLAYAYIKTYTEEGYRLAEQELRGIFSSARKNPSDVLLQAESLQVFLYSVMAGRAESENDRPAFARKALALGKNLLEEPESSPGVQFEALNALGITWMRIAEAGWEGFAYTESSWITAQNYFDRALAIVPNSVRVLQNLAKLKLIQARKGLLEDTTKRSPDTSGTERRTLLEQAKQLVMRSIEVNDQDQYPFKQLAEIAIEQRDGKAALSFIREGRNKPGAVKPEEWAKVEAEAMEVLANRWASE